MTSVASSNLISKAKSGHMLTLGTRPSQLARWQTDYVAAALRAAWPDLQTETKIYTTRGDRELKQPLPSIGGKGVFTAEIEAALRAGEVDLAVHSFKDLPIETAEGLTIGAVLERADPHDVLVSRHGLPLEKQAADPRIGTSSPRRAAQILAIRPDARIIPIRGNVDTRLRKASGDEYDAIVLAAAGLARLGLEERATQKLPFDVMLPAPAQGALAVQCRVEDEATLALLQAIHHQPTWIAVSAERAFLDGLGGGCALPVAAYASSDGGRLNLQGLVASPDGKHIIRVAGEGLAAAALDLGQRMARQALERGARRLLEASL